MTIRRVPAAEPLESRTLMARVLGIDVSDFQGDITVSEWTQIKNSGREFAFVKATEGMTFTATTFANNITRARQAGVLVGAYHYGRPDNNTAQQDADNFISKINPYLISGNLRPVLDIEVDAGDVTFMSNWVNAFCNRVKTVTGISPIVYTGQFFASTNFNSSVTQWPLWIARYPIPTPDPLTASPGSTTPWPTWNFWQYTASGTVPGISGNVDLNVFNGEMAALQANFVIKAPKATVLNGVTPIPDGAATPIDFGSVIQGQTGPTMTFTVRNDGLQALTLSSLGVPAGYTVTEGLSSPLLAGATDNFTVRLDSAIAGVKTGQVAFNTNDPTANPFNFAVTGTVNPSDLVPPDVLGSSFLFETNPHRLAILFSENVGASLGAGDFEVTNLDGGVSPIATLSIDPSGTVATLNYGGTLADGNYRLRVVANGVNDVAGNPMTADHILDFFVFSGDANRDRSVNLSDFAIVAGNFNAPGTFSAGDFNYSGTVEIGDFSILASRFNTSLPPAARAGVAAAMPTPFATRPLATHLDDLILSPA